MRFFSYLTETVMDQLFFQKPQYFDKNSKRELLANVLGATLYMPALRQNIHNDIVTNKHIGLTSLVFDLEDGIGDLVLDKAENHLVQEIRAIYLALKNGNSPNLDFPLMFIRIRNVEQFKRIRAKLGEGIQALTGVVLPKFAPEAGEELLAEVRHLSTESSPFYAMPILESGKVIKKETRMAELCRIKELLDNYKNYILNIRIGATDFSGMYGIRRKSGTTVYDIAILRDCIADIINVFQRADSPYVISGPVWEYFPNNRLNKGRKLNNQDVEGFMREIFLDIENGLIGKTIIHPTQIKPVQALNVVSFEDYIDALNIMEVATGEVGILKSQFANKMNEIKPHYYWAKKVLLKSQVYGVLHEEYTCIDLIQQEAFV